MAMCMLEVAQLVLYLYWLVGKLKAMVLGSPLLSLVGNIRRGASARLEEMQALGKERGSGMPG